MNKFSGIDLHSNNSVVVVSDEADRVVYQRRLPNDPVQIRAALAPHRADLVGVVIEATFNWYWLVDELMNDGFYQRRGKWWLHVIGKGGAEGEVPVGDALMADFARYRAFHGLSPVPAASEVGPAVMSIAGDDARHLTPAAIYLIVRDVFRRAADALDAIDPVGATTLRRASTHWLRHSAASHQADVGTDLRFIQKNLRHASIETTGIYLHAEDDRRHTQTTNMMPRSDAIIPPDEHPA